MKVILSRYLASICSAMSVTGPQTREEHSCGVENSSATGFLPTTLAKSSLCMSLGGERVSIFDTSPFAVSSVSVCTFGALEPIAGIGSADLARTLTLPAAPVSVPLDCLVADSTAYLPDLANGMSAP